MKTLLRSLYLLPVLCFFSCSNDSGPVDPPTTGTGGKISAGQTVEAARRTLPGSGGTLSVQSPGSPLDGLELTLPADGFAQTQEFVLSYAEITAHGLGPNFNPVSPLISITYGGGYSPAPMTLTVPIDLPEGHFAMGFFYDELTGSLEAIPVLDLDTGSITLSTRTLAPGDHAPAGGLLGKPQAIRGMLVISSISQSVLEGQPVIASGFMPGADDWEFVNRGSYISPKGHCAGQALSAMWYFYEKRLTGDLPLHGRFDRVNDPAHPDSAWWDNPGGYRFASTIQADQVWGKFLENLFYYANRPRLTWHSFLYAILLTGQPQYVMIGNFTAKAYHAMIAYKINPQTGSLYIADPNYPGNRAPWGTPSTRIIEYENGSFTPYPTGLVSGGSQYDFDMIAFAGKTSYIEWSKITERWAEFDRGTIGDDRFPAYTLRVLDGDGFELKDTLTTYASTLDLHVRSDAAAGWIPGTDHLQEFFVFDQFGAPLGAGTNTNLGVLQLPIPPALESRLGFLVMGIAADEKRSYVDFRWVDIRRPRSDIDFSRVRSIGLGVSSLITRWKLGNGESREYPMTITFSAEVTRDGNTFTGYRELSGDTVRVTLGSSSIHFQAGNSSKLLGGLGTARAVIAGTITGSPVARSGGFRYYEEGPFACEAIATLILEASQGTTFEGYSCVADSSVATSLEVWFDY